MFTKTKTIAMNICSNNILSATCMMYFEIVTMNVKLLRQCERKVDILYDFLSV